MVPEGGESPLGRAPLKQRGRPSVGALQWEPHSKDNVYKRMKMSFAKALSETSAKGNARKLANNVARGLPGDASPKARKLLEKCLPLRCRKDLHKQLGDELECSLGDHSSYQRGRRLTTEQLRTILSDHCRESCQWRIKVDAVKLSMQGCIKDSI